MAELGEDLKDAVDEAVGILSYDLVELARKQADPPLDPGVPADPGAANPVNTDDDDGAASADTLALPGEAEHVPGDQDQSSPPEGGQGNRADEAPWSP